MIDVDGGPSPREDLEVLGLPATPLPAARSIEDPEKVCGCHPNMPDVPSPSAAGRECLGCGWLTYPKGTPS